ncbi:MAG: MBL fold metallo-hydrolase [Acidobacteria bacterium]|nr:MBL fold metallo-hydrolase [Acidobacteriota bacterium]
MTDRSASPSWADVEDLGDGIWAIDTGFKRPLFDASHLIVEGGRAAFVDVATTFSVPRLLAALEGRGLSPADVDHVIVTHVHLDHAGGAGELLRHLPTAKLVVHPRGARHMIDPSALVEGSSAVFGEDVVREIYGEVVPVAPTRILEAPDGLLLELNGRLLHFLDTPGHARHHVCIWDEVSRSFFTGDTFGLAYPELATDRGSFIMPTTTPVQFDPDALEASIDRMLQNDPRAMLLTHYSRVTDVKRLAGDLMDQVRDLVEMARVADGRPDRATHLRTALGEYFLDRAVAHGCAQPRDELREFLAHDVELNAQGLEVWLDKAKRKRDPR